MIAVPRVLRSGFARRVATVAGGTAIGQVALVAASPALTRLYAPEDFGMLAAYMSLIAVVSAVATLRYHLAITLPERDDDALSLVWLSLGLCGSIALVAVALVATLGEPIAAALGLASGAWLWFVPAGGFLNGWLQIQMAWATRQSAFRIMGAGRATDGVAKAVCQLSFGLASKLGSTGLLLGDVIGRAAGNVVFLGRGGLRALVNGRTMARPQSLLSVARRYRDFAVFGTPGVLCNSLGLQAPALLFVALYGVEVGGIFALGQRVVMTPAVFLSSAAAQVYLGEGARLAREDPNQLRHLFRRATTRLAMLAAIPTVLLVGVGSTAFTWVFGDQWRESGVYVQIFGVSFFAQFVAQPLSYTLNILERQRWQVGWELARLVAVASAVAIPAGLGLPARYAVGCLAAATTLCYAALHLLGWIAIERCVAAASTAGPPGAPPNQP